MKPTRAFPLLAACSVLLAACGSAPPAGDAPVVPLHPQSAFAKRQQARAEKLDRSGSHYEAALLWETLRLYDPDEPAYRARLSRAQAAARRAASRHLGKARAAKAAGNEQAAVRNYLLVLANDPRRKEAAEELRALERIRNRRYFLGKPTRLTLGRNDDYLTSPAAAANAKPKAQAAPPRDEGTTATDGGEFDSHALEHAALLQRNGEFTEALAMLTRYVTANPDDEKARAQLAGTWEAYGDNALSAGRLRAALRAFERALVYRGESAQALGRKIDALKRSLGEAS